MKKLLLALPFILVSFNASARVACEDLRDVMNVPDDVCENISSAAERCFARLLTKLSSLEKQNSKSRSNDLKELASDYERESRRIRNQYLQTLNTLGEGKACSDQIAEVEVILEDIYKDAKRLNTLLSK